MLACNCLSHWVGWFWSMREWPGVHLFCYNLTPKRSRCWNQNGLFDSRHCLRVGVSPFFNYWGSIPLSLTTTTRTSIFLINLTSWELISKASQNFVQKRENELKIEVSAQSEGFESIRGAFSRCRGVHELTGIWLLNLLVEKSRFQVPPKPIIRTCFGEKECEISPTVSKMPIICRPKAKRN